MQSLTRALFVLLMTMVLVLSGCSKSVEGETKKWTANTTKVSELEAQYPGLKPALEARKASAQKIYDDAAKLDGYGHFAFMTRVAVPVTRPVVASFGVIALLAAWNQYLWPRAVVTVSEWETVQIGLKSVAASNVEESNIGFAAAIIAALPVLLLLIFLQRQLIRGLTAGAVKG